MAISVGNIAHPYSFLIPPYSISKFSLLVGKKKETIKFTSRRGGIGGTRRSLSSFLPFVYCDPGMEILPSKQEKRIKEEGREDVKIQPVENRVARQARDRAVEFFITPRRKTKSGRKG